MKRIVAGVLDVAYLEFGPLDGAPAILLHGFPYDAYACEAAAERLAPPVAARSCRSCAATGRRDSCRRIRFGQASRPRWARTCWR